MSVVLLLFGLLQGALAEAPRAPSRQVPPTILADVATLENRFELALAQDCDPERCFSRGCTYVDHAVADRPRSSSLPGFGGESGPDASLAQEYLTRASCSFAHERALSGGDVAVLVRRLESKLSGGWLVVDVESEALQPLPAYMRDPPADEDETAEEVEEVEEPPFEDPIPWTWEGAKPQLWEALLPHFYWMVGLLLLVVATPFLIWAWRRVGRVSVEEQALLAQLASEGDTSSEAPKEGEDPAAQVSPAESDAAFVGEQEAAWHERLRAAGSEHPDPQLQALIRDLLRGGELSLLAQAVLRFPDELPGLFPQGGDLATAKLELADHIKAIDPAQLPSDAEFFVALNRHALSAALASQDDAEVVRSLRDDFGPSGLVDLIGQLSPRMGALLFALSPADSQHEMVRLLPGNAVEACAGQLLRSNRMDRRETTWLFEVLRAARGGEALPPPPRMPDVSDRGSSFDAASAVSVLLAAVPASRRQALFAAALERYQGTLPAWYRAIIVPDMLLSLPLEARADLMLGVDVLGLQAWLSTLGDPARKRLLEGVPDALLATLSGAVVPREQRVVLAGRGRQQLARDLQAQLARLGLSFESLLGGSMEDEA